MILLGLIWGVRDPVRDLQVIVDVAGRRRLHSWRAALNLLLGVIEVGEHRVSRELWPESQDLHPVRIEVLDDFGLWTQKTEVVLSDRTSLVFLIKAIPFKPSDGKRARWTPETATVFLMRSEMRPRQKTGNCMSDNCILGHVPS
jgi:hypothetical protein